MWGGRVPYLKRHDVFGYLGENVLFQPTKLPNEPKLIKIHNNVKIAADVTFYEHDVINGIFSELDGVPYRTHGTCIEIYDNEFIGGRSVIIGNVSIGPNAIVQAGSVITRDVLPGTIVGGNPAVVIGDFETLHEKRRNQDGNKTGKDLAVVADELWEKFNSTRA